MVSNSLRITNKIKVAFSLTCVCNECWSLFLSEVLKLHCIGAHPKGGGVGLPDRRVNVIEI